MNYLAIKDLKKTKAVRETLGRERELIVTKDGEPFAILVSVSPDSVEESVAAIRRAMFSSAVMRVRGRNGRTPPSADDIQREIDKSREARGLK